ncbi:MerR family transcriptional regulator [Candidatus Deianiraea vastatrix]|uniref:MerR family regulatory protein n=1 Tax=Candidatus Deianiraea vastatrix TaxID=2163644 RepID=A0A5B8XGT9_9RICK|nr:MerR family transcriptional regulator [Candidatus Deianiraea vastatrix]QED23107.1 MerR family regulatory protein [Candidatus Deianiraea vastatrix]
MYKIGDVAKLTGIKTHTIRFWEKKFPHIKSANEKTRTRYYDSFCISEIIKIRDLLKEHKVTLAGIEKMMHDGKIRPRKIKKMQNIAVQGVLFSDEVSDVKIDGTRLAMVRIGIKKELYVIKNILKDLLK